MGLYATYLHFFLGYVIVVKKICKVRHFSFNQRYVKNSHPRGSAIHDQELVLCSCVILTQFYQGNCDKV